MKPLSLTPRAFSRGLAELVERDSAIRRAVDAIGLPPLWVREPGFGTLVHIILEQQVSLASASATFARLEEALPELTPEAFLRLDDDELRAIGLSRQKTASCRGLASVVLDGTFDLDGLALLSDEKVRKRLLALPGVGAWTCDLYLMLALRRPDVWPAGDIAIASGAQRMLGLGERPDVEGLARIGDAWRPWRSVAALVCWHAYRSLPQP